MSPEHRSPTSHPENRGSGPMQDPEATQVLRRVSMHEKPGHEGQGVYIVDVDDRPDLEDAIFGDTQPDDEHSDKINEGRTMTYSEQVIADNARWEAEAKESLVGRAREVLGSVALRLAEVKGSFRVLKDRYDAADPSHEGRHRPSTAGRHRTTLSEEAFGTVDIQPGDNGEGEIYVGRHAGRAYDETSPLRSNRLKRRTHKIATALDNKLHDRREGHVEDYAVPVAPAEGESVVLDTHIWQVRTSEGENVTLQRVDEKTGEKEYRKVAVSELAYWNKPETEVDPDKTIEMDAINASEDERSLFQKFRELPNLLNAKLAVARMNRYEDIADMTPEQKNKRSRRVKLAALALTAVAGIGAAYVGAKYGFAPKGNHADALRDASDLAGNGASRGSGASREAVEHFSQAAQHVSKGEGFFHTFKEMDIPKDKWSKVLAKAGPKLVKMGEAYVDPSIGGYGLKGDGKLSTEALQLISTTAKKIK